MVKIRRIYNQNKKSIWLIVLIIFFLLLILKLVNYWVGVNEEKKAMNNRNVNIVNNNYNIADNSVIKSSESAVSGEDISENQLKVANDIIEKFFDYCNNGKYQDAYDLLTNDCKEEIYNTIEVFKESYCKNVFNGEVKNVSAENWINNTYKVKINDDYLSSGKYTEQNTKIDYITIQKDENNEYKLNINGYITKNQINKESEKEKINIKVLDENEYMDYSIYTFEVTNNSYRAIMLDPLENTDSMYLQKNNDVKCVPYTHELSTAQMIIRAGEKRKIRIKYYSKFTANKKINKVVFSRIILDYDRYLNIKSKNYYNEYCSFEINI